MSHLTFKKWLLIYMLFILVIYLIGEIIEDFFKMEIKNTNNFKNYSLKVSKAGFVKIVIDWCKENMEYPMFHKYYPKVEIKYYINKKANGDYSSNSQIIRIFINNHNSIEGLVGTIIHEYTHYLQMPNKKNQIEYTQYNKTKGYYNNPYEIEAREKAKIYTPKCIKDLCKLGYISTS